MRQAYVTAGAAAGAHRGPSVCLSTATTKSQDTSPRGAPRDAQLPLALERSILSSYPRPAGTCGAVRCSWEYAQEVHRRYNSHRVVNGIPRRHRCFAHPNLCAIPRARGLQGASLHGGLPRCGEAEPLGTGPRSQPLHDDHVSMRHGMAEMPFASLFEVQRTSGVQSAAAPPLRRRATAGTAGARPARGRARSRRGGRDTRD